MVFYDLTRGGKINHYKGQVEMSLPRKRLWNILGAGLAVLSLIAGCAAPTPQSTVEPSPAAVETPTQAPIAAPSLVNPGFEDPAAEGGVSGWSVSGDEGAVLVEDHGHNGGFRLTHTARSVYRVETTQTVNGLANDWYTLSGWVRSSGGQEVVYMGLDCGGGEARVNIPATTPGYRWIRLTVSTQAVNGECTIRLRTESRPDTYTSFDDIELTPGRVALSILGADISSLKKSEDFGGVYRYRDGTQADALQILKDNGMNYARLRVWVDPADGYHNKAEIVEMAQRIKQMDMKLLVDFHYSDDWADPGKQYKPAAWKSLDFEQLTQAVYDHTYDVVSALVAVGAAPDMVQVGNEINAGMLWPDGDYNHFDNLAALLKAGSKAVKEASPTTLVMLHIAEGGDNEMARWWFDNITRRGVPFDVIGISFYPIWHGTLAMLQANLNDISARYDKDVIVVETAYPFTAEEDDGLSNSGGINLKVDGYPYTPEGQREMLRDIMAVVRGVNNGRGLGIFWWDATWTAVPGNGWDTKAPSSENGWENQALFDYDDRALPALEEFLNP